MPSKKELVEHFLKKGVLITPDFLDSMGSNNISDVPLESDRLIMDSALSKSNLSSSEINWKEFERSLASKDKGNTPLAYAKFLDYIGEVSCQSAERVKVLFSYKEKEKKPSIQDFVSYFNSRLSLMERFISSRAEIKKLVMINKIKNKRDRETISLIGLINSISVTKNKNIVLTLEDQTGTIKVLVNRNKPSLFEIAKNLTLDEVIGITGTCADKIIFASSIILPDIPLTKEFKKSPDEAYAIFLSDIHVGSKYFLENEFKKFLNWLNQRSGSPSQKEVASKVRYIFIVGDLVDGIGVYPSQEEELTIKDIYKQYEMCASYLAQIPSHIKVVICAGNHDAVRISEPQPTLTKDFASSIWQLKNVIMVSNPAYINIHASKEFSGFDVLLYHGYSFDYYIANVDMLRNSGGYDRPDLIMKFLLQKRHLAPSHTSTLYIADPERDNLVIDPIPDFFVTGHIHKSCVSQYRNVTLICGSCWQSTTSFQEKLGHHPEPCRVPVINLNTRKVKVLRFGD